MPAPKVLISDALSDAAVADLSRSRHRRRLQPDLGKDKDAFAAIIGDYDGLAIRSATKVTQKVLAAGDPPQGDRPRRHRRRQRRRAGRHRARRHRHEHAVRQLDHHRRARHRDDVRARPPDPAGRRLDAGRQVGEEPLHGRRADGQDARRHRLRQHRRHRRRPGHRPASCKVVAYDPFLTPERAVELGVEKVELDELLAAPTSSPCTCR